MIQAYVGEVFWIQAYVGELYSIQVHVGEVYSTQAYVGEVYSIQAYVNNMNMNTTLYSKGIALPRVSKLVLNMSVLIIKILQYL